MILYSTLARGPVLPFEDQLNSSRHFQRELNRLGVTSAIDAGGGGQNYPDDYKVIQELHRRGEMTMRVAYNLFAQKAGSEFDDFKRWSGMVKPGDGDAMLRMNGAGENLVWSAADFENFLQPRPVLSGDMNRELERITRLLVENRWPFRIHATYDESIAQFLDVFERVNRDMPFDGLRFIIDHAETVRPRNIERIKALGGGIAIQHRMAFQGESGIATRRRLTKLSQTPYFGRIDFVQDNKRNRVPIYIGMYSFVDKTPGILPIYDWRAPVSSMFYDFELGKAWYESPVGKINGTIELRERLGANRAGAVHRSLLDTDSFACY